MDRKHEGSWIRICNTDETENFYLIETDCFINRLSRTSLVSLEITYFYFMLTAH